MLTPISSYRLDASLEAFDALSWLNDHMFTHDADSSYHNCADSDCLLGSNHSDRLGIAAYPYGRDYRRHCMIDCLEAVVLCRIVDSWSSELVVVRSWVHCLIKILAI